MQIAYFDESGDDGFPSYSSPLFTLSTIYLHYLNWKECQEAIHKFRRDLKDSFGLPVKIEFHTKYFLLNKNPYRNFKIPDDVRIKIIGLFCDLIANLNVKSINIVIVKPRIRSTKYDVLNWALIYSVQRIENDLNPALNPNEKFMIITDSGRVGKMRKTTRKIQRINFIPSKFSPESYRREIKTLIEDPLPKDSKESYFIQLADLIAFIVYLYGIYMTGTGKYSNRLDNLINKKTIIEWMDRLEPSLNIKASGKDKYGVVFHP